MAEKALLIDVTKCTACRACQVACKQWWELPAESTKNRGTYENPPDLTPDTWTVVKFWEVPENGNVRWLFRKHGCMHCGDAPCVRMCFSGALSFHALGFVAYDETKCVGGHCGNCRAYCPFDVPRIYNDEVTGLSAMRKCLFCQNRVTNDLSPACAKACPTGAIQFGDRVALLDRGKARVAELVKTRPESSLYGEKEMGGLHVLYVLDARPEVYGLPSKPTVPFVVDTCGECHSFPILGTRPNGPGSDIRKLLQPVGLAALGLAALGLLANHLAARARTIQEREKEQGKRHALPHPREQKRVFQQ